MMRIARKIIGLGVFLPFYVFEVVRSNFRVAYDILTPRDHFQPAIVTIPLEPMSDLQLLMISNLVTMTPGTLTLDVSEDKRQLTIHAMYADDIEALIRDFKTNFEPRVRNAF